MSDHVRTGERKRVSNIARLKERLTPLRIEAQVLEA
jgi:hypothetical protein